MPKTSLENDHYHYWDTNSSRTGLGGKRKTKHTHAIIINNETGDVAFGKMDDHNHTIQEFSNHGKNV
mgnify:CR=1 FL=1